MVGLGTSAAVEFDAVTLTLGIITSVFAAVTVTRLLVSLWLKDERTRTRFGSLEFGVLVPDRADTWTRMVYSAANKPIAPIDDPYQMFAKLYGNVKDKESLRSVLDDVQDDLKKLGDRVSPEDRRLLEEHATFDAPGRRSRHGR